MPTLGARNVQTVPSVGMCLKCRIPSCTSNTTWLRGLSSGARFSGFPNEPWAVFEVQDTFLHFKHIGTLGTKIETPTSAAGSVDSAEWTDPADASRT